MPRLKILVSVVRFRLDYQFLLGLTGRNRWLNLLEPSGNDFPPSAPVQQTCGTINIVVR